MKLESVTYQPSSANPHDARTVFSFTVPKQMCNMGGSLHGGAVALIFDITTSMAISACSSEGFWDSGHVSRNRQVLKSGRHSKDADTSVVSVYFELYIALSLHPGRKCSMALAMLFRTMLTAWEY